MIAPPLSQRGGAPTIRQVPVRSFGVRRQQANLHAPIAIFARDEAGNEAKAAFVDNVFEKPFKRSRIEVDDRFFSRVVPEILEHSLAFGAGVSPAFFVSPH